MLEVKRKIREDWALHPFLAFTSASFIIAVVDFVFLQNLRFQLSGLIGVFFSVIGGYLRYKAKLELKKKADYKSLLSPSKLQIVEDHRLVTDGLYRHI